jgi:tape measure domain-containing protein|nr:MAG TPA: tail tape measure protein [Caudoviricetes sp.]
MATLGLDTSEYEQGIEQARKETQSAANSLNRSANTAGSGVSGMANQFAAASAKATVLANMLTSLGTKAVGLAKGFVEMGISYNAQIEKYTTGFTNMLGSAQAAQEAMQAIQEDAARTPFDVASLTQANQLLISAGENAAYSRKVINALGDAVSATGGGNAELSRMAQNLQQIANVGKAASIDIKQFAYAGINIYQVLADYTGKSVQEVQNMTISYDLLSQALIAASEEGGRYYNAMDTQSQTMNGRISTLKDNVSQLAGLMTGDLSSGIGVVIGHLNDMVVAAQEAYKEDGWKGLGNAILELDNPISAIIKKFGQLGSAAVSALDKASYYLNKALGKNAYAGYDSYEDYKSDQQKQSNRNRLRQNALSGKSVSNKSWSERQAEAAAASGGSSIVTSPSSSSGKSAGTKSKTETVIASVSHTATTTAQNALGAVTTSVETLQEKVKDAAGNIKDRVTETTTETGKEMVNGVATTYTLVTKKVTDANGKISTTTKKVYADMSKTLTGTLTKVAETTFDGITTKIQEATEKYADGSEHIKKTVTETGQRIGKNGAETYEKIITYIDGIEDKVNETSTAIDNSVKGIQSRIDQYLSDASGESNKGIFGLLKSTISDAKNKDWSSLALDVTKLIWGEVSQGQRETISKWFDNALAAVNESYYGGGLKSAFTAVESLFKDGIVPGVNNATTAVDSFSKVVSGLASSGGVGGALGSIVQGFSGMAGGITSALGTVVSFISANPVLGIILGVGAVGAVAGGIGLALWAKNKKSKDPVNNYKSPFDDVGVYDSLSEFSTRSAMQYRVIGQSSHADKQTSILERIEELLDEHLPAIGTGQVVMDSGELVGVISPRMAQNVDARIGVTVTRKARGV